MRDLCAVTVVDLLLLLVVSCDFLWILSGMKDALEAIHLNAVQSGLLNILWVLCFAASNTHFVCLKGTQISNFDCWGVRAGGARSTCENGQTLTTETQIENR